MERSKTGRHTHAHHVTHISQTRVFQLEHSSFILSSAGEIVELQLSGGLVCLFIQTFDKQNSYKKDDFRSFLKFCLRV